MKKYLISLPFLFIYLLMAHASANILQESLDGTDTKNPYFATEDKLVKPNDSIFPNRKSNLVLNRVEENINLITPNDLKVVSLEKSDSEEDEENDMTEVNFLYSSKISIDFITAEEDLSELDSSTIRNEHISSTT